jgi:outer membrane lipoprotein-sorting protein
MKPAEDIKRYFENAALRTNPQAHERVFADVLRAHQQTLADSPARPERWRTIMRHPVTKYAVAAAFILAVLLAFGLFDRTGSVSWAIEQSVAAMSQYTALRIEGLASERAFGPRGSLELRPFQVWGVADANQTKVEKYRFEYEGVTYLVTDGHKTWKYEPQAHRVTIRNEAYQFSECWLGSGFLEQLKQARERHTITHWEETSGPDPAAGKPRVILTVVWLEAPWTGPRSLRLEFDGETKLLVRMTQWDNDRQEGTPAFVADKITYCESLPDDLFEFQIPPGAQVVEQ